MSITVCIPVLLRQWTRGESELTCDGSTIGEVLCAIEDRHPQLKGKVLDASRRAVRFVSIFVNDTAVDAQCGLSTPLEEGDVVTILPALAGGAPPRLAHDVAGPAAGDESVLAVYELATDEAHHALAVVRGCPDVASLQRSVQRALEPVFGGVVFAYLMDERAFDAIDGANCPEPELRRASLEWFVQKLVAEYLFLAQDEIERDAPLGRYGLDSAGALDLLGALETAYDLTIDLESFQKQRTVASIAAYVLAEIAGDERSSATGSEATENTSVSA